MTSEVQVTADGRGDFQTIQAAIDEAPLGRLVRIGLAPGIYREKIVIPASKTVELHGQDVMSTTITWDDYATKAHREGGPYGTLRTPTMWVEADDVIIENVSIENSAAPRSLVGQAVALALRGRRCQVLNARLLGHQDTLYVGGEGPHYFKLVEIAGDVDYIFGPAPTLFEDCRLISLGQGYITAASTPKDEEVGYVFWHCHLAASGDFRTYLGRPWRPYASVTWIETEMGAHIAPEGWDNWRDPANQETARYAEFGSSGPGGGARERVAWAKTSPHLEELPDQLHLANLRRRWGFGPKDEREGGGLYV